MAAPSSSRFANLDDEEYELLLQDKDIVNTKKSTKTAVIIFRDYLSDKAGLHTNFFSWWPSRATKIINY